MSTIYMIIKSNRVDTGGYHYYTTGASEVVSLDGTERQFIAGIQIQSFDLVSSIGTFEDSNQDFSILETDGQQYFQTYAASNNLYLKEVVFLKKTGNVLIEANALYIGKIVEIGVNRGVWKFTCKNKYTDFARTNPAIITADEFPNASTSSLNQEISKGIGLASSAMIPPTGPTGPGAVNAWQISTSGAVSNYVVLQTIGSIYGEETVQEVYRDGIFLPSWSQYVVTDPLGYWKRLMISGVGGAVNPLQCYVKGTTRETRLLICFIRMLWMAGYLELSLPGTSDTNTEFDTIMNARGFQDTWEILTAYMTGEAYSFNDLAKHFQDSFACDIRMSQGKIEAKCLDFGNISAQSSLTLEPGDILQPGIEYSTGKIDDLKNDVTAGYTYAATVNQNAFSSSLVSPSAAKSIEYFGNQSEQVDFRFGYLPHIAHAMKKFYVMKNSIPYIETRFSVLESRLPDSFQAGDIFRLVDVNDITAGKEYRWYQVKRLSRKTTEGIADLVCQDVTDLNRYDFSCKCLIQADKAGDTTLRNYSPAKSNEILTTSITQVSDTAFPGGLCFQSTASGSQIAIAYSSYDNVSKRLIDYTQTGHIEIPFFFKLTSVSVDQTFFMARHTSSAKDSYLKISFRASDDVLIFRYKDQDGGVDYTANSSAYSFYPAIDTVYHCVFSIHIQNDGLYRMRLHINGSRVANTASVSMPATAFDCYYTVGTFVSSGGLKSERFTGRMQDFGIFHDQSWNSNAATCTNPTALTSFFGPNGANQYTKHFYIV